MFFSLCRKNLTPLQRRSVQLLGSVCAFTVVANGISHFVLGHTQRTVLSASLLSAIAVGPVILAIWVIGRYLSAEPDEFIRALAVRALLWAVAVTMVGDAIAGVLSTFYATPLPLGLLNADLFFVSTGIAARLILRSYR